MNPQKGVHETHPQMSVSHSSSDVSHRAEKGEDGHVTGVAPGSSHVHSLRDLKFVKSEDEGKEDARVSHMDSISLLKPQKTVHSLQRTMELKKSHCSQCLLHEEKCAELENEIHELQKQGSEIKIVQLEFKQEIAELKQQLHNLRYTLEEELKRRNDDLLHEKIKDQLKEKETECNKEDKERKQPEISVSTLDTELKSPRNKCNQVSTSNGTENKLLHKYHRMKDETCMRNQGIDTIKYQKQEKKCLENTEILTEKNGDLPRTYNPNEKTLTEAFQDNDQFNIWKAENTVHNLTLESEKQNTERLDTEVKSHSARPPAAPPYHDESQTPKRNLEFSFQRARDKDFTSPEENNIVVSNLKISSEIPSQQVPKSDIKTSENELFQTRDTLSKGVYFFSAEKVNTPIEQRKCQWKVMTCRYQDKERKRSDHLRKQDSSGEKILSKLQSENTLLKDQLRDCHNKVDDKKDGVVENHANFYEIKRIIETQSARLDNAYMALIKENNHFKEHLDQEGKDKAEKVVMENLEKQMAGTLKLQSVVDSSIEHKQNLHINLEVRRQDLQKTRGQITSQMDDLTTRMDMPTPEHLHLEDNNQCFTEISLHLQNMQNKISKIKRTHKKNLNLDPLDVLP